MRVAVVGLGYVGLVTGVCLADRGHDVTGVDLDEGRVRSISEGRAPIFEVGLDDLLARTVGNGFRATTDLTRAVASADVTMIAVGTPFDGRQIDLGAVRAATRAIGEALREHDGFPVVVVKSTVVPGTARDVVRPALEEASGRRVGVDVGLGVNPEFLTEGRAVEDFMQPDRLVLGADDDRTLERLEELYSVFPDVPRVRTTPTAAETIKYASNAMLAAMISFSNELADLCTAVGDADVVDVMRGLHSSMYLAVGGKRAPITSFLEAGCGFGGSCLPKDVSALVAHGEALGRPMPVLRAVLDVNERRADEVMAILGRHLPSLEGRRVTVLGLAFKPDTDDVRESPAIPIVDRLLEAGAAVRIHDPVVSELPEALPADRLELTSDLRSAVAGSDAVVLVTRWAQYPNELPDVFAGLAEQPVLVDGRRVIAPGRVQRYDGIGLAADRVASVPRGRD